MRTLLQLFLAVPPHRCGASPGCALPATAPLLSGTGKTKSGILRSFCTWLRPTFVDMSKAKAEDSSAKARKKRGSSGGASGGQSCFEKVLDPPFEKYWSKERVQQGLKRGELFEGSVTISNSKFEIAFVTNSSGGPDFFLTNFHARNRALQDDVVVVQPLSYVEPAPSGHSVQRSRPAPSGYSVQRSRQPDLSTLSLQDNTPTPEAGTTTTSDVDTPTGELESSAQAPMTLIDRLYMKRETTRPDGADERQRTAKVVYISVKSHSRALAGTLKAYDKGKGLAMLASRDHKVPRTLVSLDQLPSDVCMSFKKYALASFVCRIKDWTETSPFPVGDVMRSLGEAGVIEKEMTAILLDQQIDDVEFSPEVEACLPKTLPWKLPEEEVKKRRDFRGECVLSVDPETARDLDDALHIKKLSHDLYEVGVHIADVSYFVEQGSALDAEASKRATSTYLVHKVIPMLPRLLCENLCSLNPNEDKLSFSVVWELSANGEFKSEWIGRSVIRSRCKLSYGHAQKMIDGEWREEDLPPVADGTPVRKVVESVVQLNKLAVALAGQRKNKGTLRLNQPKLHFLLNHDTGMPMGCEIYPIRQSNRMIEEFMLLANMTVARRLVQHFSQGAMLRRHPLPKEDLKLVKGLCEKLGIEMDVKSAHSIQNCLDAYQGRSKNPSSSMIEQEKLILINMIVKTMELALYFSSEVPPGISPHHYALNVPLYTHFTSPIRRYADVVVHRQLAHALGEGPEFTSAPEDVAAQAVICNKKKRAAKLAGDSSIDVFFSIYLKEIGPQKFNAVVLSVLDRSFDILLKDYGLVRRVLLQKQSSSLVDFKYHCDSSSPPTLTLSWGEKTEHAHKVHKEQVIQVFAELPVMVSASSNMLENQVDLIPPPMK